MAFGICSILVGAAALAALGYNASAARILKKIRSNHTGQTAVNTSSLGPASCGIPCPMGRWDGANCLMFTVSTQANPFFYNNHFYYGGVESNEGPCPYAVTNAATNSFFYAHYDGANCLVARNPGSDAGQLPFIWEGKYYLSANCWGDKVVTLGDSYSAGVGIHRAGDQYDEEFGGYPAPYKLTIRSDNECWREKQTTPGPLYATALGKESVFLACKGALNTHVENQLAYANSLYPTDAFNKWEGSVILFTSGGNDLRTQRGEDWPELLKRCILEVNPFQGCDDSSKNQISNWASVQSGAQALYERLARDASKAQIRVMGYPRLMMRDPGCSSVTGVSRDEADWMDGISDTLNQHLQAALNAVKADYPSVDIQFVDVRSYITIGACGPKATRQVNDKVLDGVSTSDASFHPTQFGFDRYYTAFAHSLNR